MRNALGTGDQPHHQRILGFDQAFWNRHAQHDRNIGGLDAAIGEIDAGRGFEVRDMPMTTMSASSASSGI